MGDCEVNTVDQAIIQDTQAPRTQARRSRHTSCLTDDRARTRSRAPGHGVHGRRLHSRALRSLRPRRRHGCCGTPALCHVHVYCSGGGGGGGCCGGGLAAAGAENCQGWVVGKGATRCEREREKGRDRAFINFERDTLQHVGTIVTRADRARSR